MIKPKHIKYLVALVLLSGCGQEIETEIDADSSHAIASDSTLSLENFDITNKEFNTGGGLGGYFISFYENDRFETFSFCDICPGSGTIGTYRRDGATIYMLDSACYENKPHFTDSSVFVDCWGSTMTVYHLIQRGKMIYLSDNPKDTIDPETAQIDGSYPSYEMKEISHGLSSHLTP